MSARRYDTTRIIKILLLVLSIVGIWFLYKKWLFEKKIRPRLLALIGDLGQADIVFNSLVRHISKRLVPSALFAFYFVPIYLIFFLW